MATMHFGLVIYGCAIASILRSHGVASAPVQSSEASSDRANQITDLEQQLMQQSGENKSSHPAPSPVNQGELAEGQDAPADDALADEAEATGLSSDYYGLPSAKDTIDDTNHPERWNNQLREDSNEDNEAAAAEGEEEEDANTDGKPMDDQMYNGRHQEVDGISNFGERYFEDDAEEIEQKENDRENRNEDDIEQNERPWEGGEGDLESQEAPSSELVASEKTTVNEGETPKKAGEEKKQQEADEEDGQETRDNRQKLEQQRYAEDGQDNAVTTFNSRLLISREKKTLQGRRLPVQLDKSDRHKDDEGPRYVDDDFTGYM